MKLSKNQPGENNGHCWERFPLVSNPHTIFQPSCAASPPRTPAGHALCLLALFVAQAEPARPFPHAAPQRLAPGLCFRGGARHWVSGRAADLGPRERGRRSSPRAEHPCRGPALRCLQHYRKPLCSHCVGGVISEGLGDSLRSLLGWNLLSRSDHSPLAAGTGRAFTKA